MPGREDTAAVLAAAVTAALRVVATPAAVFVKFAVVFAVCPLAAAAVVRGSSPAATRNSFI
jgi:hypothetical protein